MKHTTIRVYISMCKNNRDINIWDIVNEKKYIFFMFPNLLKGIISNFKIVWNISHGLIFSGSINKSIVYKSANYYLIKA
jgi:hypothetical protein